MQVDFEIAKVLLRCLEVMGAVVLYMNYFILLRLASCLPCFALPALCLRAQEIRCIDSNDVYPLYTLDGLYMARVVDSVAIVRYD